jgi:methyl-accepting chemotaxis protein
MADIDFAIVKMAHRSWRLKLRGFLDGRENIDPKQLASHEQCDLGKWIYSAGGKKYGNLSDMQSLEKRHKAMHGMVRQVVELKQAGNTPLAEQEYKKVITEGDAVVELIAKVEKQVH